ncbi:hypothetical protein DF185_01325 [Marinifilum breve]|uniref:Uncharacterized protein n=1 Tax=Marinifilum breve TaxID=2184082 RepID=A0A2V4A271_9BACT|nr:hypothetical protein DF185_01325 [Marinifilum breve]
MKNQFILKNIVAIIICLINIWWTYDNAYLLYCYHFKSVFYFSMYPDWVLVVNSLIGLLGLISGILVINGKIKLWIAITFNLLIWTLGLLIK